MRNCIAVFRNYGSQYDRSYAVTASQFDRNETHGKSGGKELCSYITYPARRPLVIFDERLNSIKYIDIRETYLPTTFPQYPPGQLPKVFHQDDNARQHVSTSSRIFAN